jgi:predicted branched-subunit amino acid permease
MLHASHIWILGVSVLLFIWILGFIIGAILELSAISPSPKDALFIIPPVLMTVMILTRMKAKRFRALIAVAISILAILWGFINHQYPNARGAENQKKCLHCSWR